MGIGYDIALVTATMVMSPLWTYSLWRSGKWRTDWPARFGRCAAVRRDGRPILLVHAVSVGEVNAIRMLVDELGKHTNWQIVISTTTDTGTARAQTLFKPAHRVVRYPFDLSPVVNRFLATVKPDLVALVELELWPNFAEACQRRCIPLCVLNGRLSEASFRRYRIVRPIVRPMFARLAAAAVQTPAYAARFTNLGVPNDRIQVLDTMKWDTAQIADEVRGASELAEALGIDRNKPLIVAGSTAPGEDALLMRTCPLDAQLLLAPRKPEWFDRVADLDSRIIRRSKHPNGTRRPCDGQRLFLLDTIGELRCAYALADVVIVGRSFLGLFGSDMIEPIALGKPTIIGPHHCNFTDAVTVLAQGGGLIVTDKPGPVAAELLTDRRRAASMATRGRQVIGAHQGATHRHVTLLKSLMPTHASSDSNTGATKQ